MRRTAAVSLLASLLMAGPALAQTAIEYKKELKPKIDKAKAEGKDLGPALEFYNEGDKLLKDGLQEEATEAFKKAKDAMPKE